VTVVDEKIRDYWILETCKSTLKRISAAEEARQMESPSVESLMKLGFSRVLSEGVVRSVAHYQTVDFEKYRAVVIDALKYLLPEYQTEIPEIPVESPEEIDEEENIDNEEKVLAIIDRLDKKGKGAPWDEIVEEAKKEGIEKNELEEITNSLLDKGLIYEPILGKMKRI
jgi:hypothetical protein